MKETQKIKAQLAVLRKVQPQHPKLFAHIADCLIRQQKFKLAAKILDKGLKQFPDYAAGWIVKGNLHLFQNQPDKALSAFKRSLELDPNNPYALERCVDLSVEKNDRDAIIDYLRRLRSIDPLDDGFQTMFQTFVLRKIAVEEGIFRDDEVDRIMPGVLRETIVKHNLMPQELERQTRRWRVPRRDQRFAAEDVQAETGALEAGRESEEASLLDDEEEFEDSEVDEVIDEDLESEEMIEAAEPEAETEEQEEGEEETRFDRNADLLGAEPAALTFPEPEAEQPERGVEEPPQRISWADTIADDTLEPHPEPELPDAGGAADVPPWSGAAGERFASEPETTAKPQTEPMMGESPSEEEEPVAAQEPPDEADREERGERGEEEMDVEFPPPREKPRIDLSAYRFAREEEPDTEPSDEAGTEPESIERGTPANIEAIERLLRNKSSREKAREPTEIEPEAPPELGEDAVEPDARTPTKPLDDKVKITTASDEIIGEEQLHSRREIRTEIPGLETVQSSLMESDEEPEPEPEAPSEAEPPPVDDQARRRLMEVAGEVVGKPPETGPAVSAEEPEPKRIATKTLAELYASQGNWRQAVEVYEELLSRYPTNTAYRQRLEELKGHLESEASSE